VSPEQLLGQLEAGRRVVIADMEAGAGTLTRMPPGSLDVALLIVEPSAKSIDMARRAAAIIAERKIGMVLVAANRLRSEQDVELVRTGLPGADILAVPEDPRVAQADREARSPIDVAPDGPGVRAIRGLATRLERRPTQAGAATRPVVR
jgi:CO dehydrogenase nickel-insertion accessory protein CooC1